MEALLMSPNNTTSRIPSSLSKPFAVIRSFSVLSRGLFAAAASQEMGWFSQDTALAWSGILCLQMCSVAMGCLHSSRGQRAARATRRSRQWVSHLHAGGLAQNFCCAGWFWRPSQAVYWILLKITPLGRGFLTCLTAAKPQLKVRPVAGPGASSAAACRAALSLSGGGCEGPSPKELLPYGLICVRPAGWVWERLCWLWVHSGGASSNSCLSCPESACPRGLALCADGALLQSPYRVDPMAHSAPGTWPWVSGQLCQVWVPFPKVSWGKRLKCEGRFVAKRGKASDVITSPHLTPSPSIQFHPIPICPTPSCPIPPTPSYPVVLHPIPSHLTPSHLTPSHPISSRHPCQPPLEELAAADPWMVEVLWSIFLSRMCAGENRNLISKIRRRFIMEFVNFRRELYSQFLQTTQGEVTLSKTLEIF